MNVGSGPIAVAVDDVRNKIFVADSGSDTLTVINGKTNATSSINVGRNPYAVAVNPLANVIYAVNRGDATVTIVDGATRLGRTVPAGTGANSIALNIVTNKAYITNTVNRTVTIIDGAIASLRSVPGSTSYVSKVRPAESVPGRFVIPYAVAVNSATNKVYVADKSGGLFTLNVDRNQTLPLKTTISGLSDSQTVSTENVFQTRNAAPRFDVEVTSTFAESTSYSGVPGAVNLAPTAVYYEVDGGNRWTTASMTKINGANSTSFTVQLTGQDVGAHTLYVYPVYGAAPSTYSDGSTESLGGNALQVGNLSAYAYQIDPVI